MNDASKFKGREVLFSSSNESLKGLMTGRKFGRRYEIQVNKHSVYYKPLHEISFINSSYDKK